MPKSRATAPQDPPKDDLEATEAPPAKPARKKLRTTANAADAGHFGGPPRGATHWGVRRYKPDGTLDRVAGPSGDGNLIVHEWPLEELDESISTRLPPGKYRLEWIGNGAKGQRTFLAWGRDFTVGASASSPAATIATSSAPSSPIPTSSGPGDAITMMREMRSLAREELETVERQVEHRIGALAKLAELMRPQAPAESPQLVALLTRIDQRLTALEEGGGGDDDAEEEEDEEEEEDDEDEDEEPPAADDGKLFKPGEPITDAAVTAGLNKVASFLDSVTPGAAAVALEWLNDKAAEMQARRAAAANASHTLNGHVPTTSPATSSPTATEGGEAAG